MENANKLRDWERALGLLGNSVVVVVLAVPFAIGIKFGRLNWAELGRLRLVSCIILGARNFSSRRNFSRFLRNYLLQVCKSAYSS